MPNLIFTRGPRRGEALPLTEEGTVIGRADDCTLVIQDNLISSHHARLFLDDGRWMITDLQSTNGTLVNGKPVDTSPLSNRDLVEVGEMLFMFRDEAVAEEGGRPAQAPDAAAGDGEADLELVKQMNRLTEAIRREAGKVIVGQIAVLDQILMAMIAGGHALLVGMPGMAKTLMVRTIARVLDLQFKRIQFTPDLMPTDITGTEVLETNRDTMEREFRFIPGPLFCNLLLADEINRTPPKTQAALLEAMQERSVTVGNKTYDLDSPFFVLATQNPIEQEGTYPLPEAQQDRFMFNIWVDYPLEHEEETIVRTTTVTRVTEPDCILSKEQVLRLQDVVRKIPASEHLVKYAIRLVRASRPVDPKAPDFIRQYVHVGAGPRAGQFLILAAKARAVLDGRIHVSCNDIKHAAIPVLRHRIYTNFAADSEGLTSMDLIRRLLESVEPPSEKDYR